MSLAENSGENQRVWGKPFQKGVSGNPAGKPKGCKHKLGEAFVVALHEDFIEHGPQVIRQVRNEQPAQYLRVIAQIVPKDFTINLETFQNISDDQLATIIDAARACLGIIDGSATDITEAQSGKSTQALQAIQEAK